MNKTIYQHIDNKRYSLFFVLLISVLSVSGETPYIINTESMEKAMDFSIHVSGIRILFEPLFGPILFFLRSYDPIPEFFSLFGWVAIGLFLLFLFKIFKKQETPLGGLFRWFIYSILLSGLWLMTFIFMISGPLPSNTVKNDNPDRILFNTHTHSHWSHDGLISPIQQMAWHKRNGYDAFFLTEHNHNNNTLNIVNDQKTGQLPDRPHIITGIEFSGSNHMLLLGLKSPLITFGLNDKPVIDSTHLDGGLVAVAHWFSDENNTIQHYLDLGVDGFEIDNRNNIYSNEVRQNIINTCDENNLFMLGSADYHGYGSAAHVWNGIQIPKWTSLSHLEKTNAILTQLKEKKFNAVQVFRYIDRPVFVQWNVWLSPIYSTIAYFKSLSFTQTLSWVGWLVLFQLFKRTPIYMALTRDKLQLMASISFVSALGVLVLGVTYLQKAKPLIGFNEQYQEFGLNFSAVGVLFAFVSLGIIRFYKKLS